MSVRWVEQDDARYGIVRRFWLCDLVISRADGTTARIRRVAPAATKKGAEDFARRLLEDLARPRVLPTLTLGVFVRDRWWPVYPSAAGNRPSTVREKRCHLDVHLLRAFGDLALADVRGECVEKFVARLRGEGRSPKTIKNLLTTLKTILGSAAAWGLLAAVPIIKVPRVPERPVAFYTASESERLLAAAANPHERTLLLFALHTGARAGEQLAAEWSDLDAHGVVFQRSETRGIMGPTKSTRLRRVPLTARLRDALSAGAALSPRRGERIFVGEGERPLGLRDLHRALDHATARAGLRRLRWHDLRHSYASQHAIAGVTLRQLQAWLGHASIVQTERYAHLVADTERHPACAIVVPHAGAPLAMPFAIRAAG
jgi:integrase